MSGLSPEISLVEIERMMDETELAVYYLQQNMNNEAENYESHVETNWEFLPESNSDELFSARNDVLIADPAGSQEKEKTLPEVSTDQDERGDGDNSQENQQAQNQTTNQGLVQSSNYSSNNGQNVREQSQSPDQYIGTLPPPSNTSNDTSTDDGSITYISVGMAEATGVLERQKKSVKTPSS